MTIECKDLEWGGVNMHGVNDAYGVLRTYWYNNHNGRYYLRDSHLNNKEPYKNIGNYATEEEAQAAANEHNKQQFYKLIEQWRKG